MGASFFGKGNGEKELKHENNWKDRRFGHDACFGVGAVCLRRQLVAERERVGERKRVCERCRECERKCRRQCKRIGKRRR